MRRLNRSIETKQSVFTSSDGTEILHNNFITVVNGNLLQTSQGAQDPNTSNSNNRIGDKIHLKGVALKMMVELNERYSDVTFRLMVVRTARNITPDRTSLFTGLSGNKMLDTLNTERYTIIAQKYFKIKSPNTTATSGTEIGTGAGVTNWGLGQGLSRATKIVKLWIPGTKFAKGGNITYENNSTSVKFFDYHVLLYAYSNYSTLQDVWNVGRLNDYVQVMYFTDL